MSVGATAPAAGALASSPAARSIAARWRRVALRFELNGRAFPLPLVRGTVAGEPTWMLVDTGANSHIIAGWLARKAGLTLHALGAIGTDHAGKAVRTYSVDHPAVNIDGWGPLADGPMLVTDVPDAIAAIGIGAFVSPQWLVSGDDGLVLDLPRREMRTLPWSEAVRELDDAASAPLTSGEPTRACRGDAGGVPELAFVLRGTVEGNAVDLLLDTGATRTDLLMTSKAARRLAPRARPSEEPIYAASGLVQTRSVSGLHMRIGDWTATTDVDLVPGTADPLCPRDGVVGMDALAGCVLVLGQRQSLARCSR